MSSLNETSSDKKHWRLTTTLSLDLLSVRASLRADWVGGTARFSRISTMPKGILRVFPGTARSEMATSLMQLQSRPCREPWQTLAKTRRSPKEYHVREERHFLAARSLCSLRKTSVCIVKQSRSTAAPARLNVSPDC
jgi:hypothetical protein